MFRGGQGSEKLKKGWKYGAGAGLLKKVVVAEGRGVWHLSCSIFSRFIIFTFRNYFTLVVKCNCKSSTKTPYGANNCSYRKISLPCISACGNCHGNNCTNVSKFEIMGDLANQSFEMNALELSGI